MARYRLTERAYIGHQVLEAGAEIDFVGVPGPHMVCIDPPPARVEEAAPVAEGDAYG